MADLGRCRATMTEIESEISRLRSVAQNRWLKPSEVLFILENCDDNSVTAESPNKPPSGSLFLFNRRVLRFFRNDGHSWRRKKDGRAVGEAHERLKVGNLDKLNCYYAHGEENPYFQRRSYWILDPALEHIVLVHYRDIREGSYHMPGTVLEPLGSSRFPFNSGGSGYLSSSPLSAEVVSCESSVETVNSGVDAYEHVPGGRGTSLTPHFNRALRKLELQLSLEDDDYDYNDVKETIPPYIMKEYSGGFGDGDSGGSEIVHSAGKNQKAIFRPSDSEVNENKPSIFWEEMFELTASSSPGVSSQEKASEEVSSSSGRTAAKPNEVQIYPETSNSRRVSEDLTLQSVDLERNSEWHLSAARRILLGPDSPIDTSTSTKHTEEYDDTTIPYKSGVFFYGGCSSLKGEESTVDFPKYSEMVFDQSQSSCLTLSQRQLFSICEICPAWAYSSETTKVIIVGDFLCDHLHRDWKVMFGDVEVPVEIIQKGVIKCMAPHHIPGRVPICLTSGNRESCSEIREFEYYAKPESLISPTKKTFQEKNAEELTLLMKLAQILLKDQTGETDRRFKRVSEFLLSGNEDNFDAVDWLLQELLKGKLEEWLVSRTCESQPVVRPLTREEQNIIHVISGLGYEWALNPLLNSGVGVNFRDSNGWTALHWAARFGREKMVASLVAAGASTVAVTDPTTLNPSGKTPASIAADFSHKGLAGYLSEVSLTSHLSSLTVEESTLESFRERDIEIHPGTTEDQLSLKDSLAAVRNATLAAARIQSAFRAHSFRKRQSKSQPFDPLTHKERNPHLSTWSKAPRIHSAALFIQRKYRGWKWRRNYLIIRQNVVKIQAHIRGHQVRKKYREFIWTVGVLEKVVLRWRRRGVGLRGFKVESETMDEEIDGGDDDILKIFRKQKVDAALDEAVKRVLSVVESTEARQQYRRMLERYRIAKAELGGSGVDRGVGLLEEEAMISESRDDL